ncbi:cell wall metabolism sensor histidine kinase WalK [uncultured Treponema sp.]|uniref:sensor histidine kinase n=1 Tax=uncultured Treponema sp. TaxID=162155 RepID=UPI0025EF9B4E|nr:HAMP domain-containing sensor histidine kinase [uncultured Treponema sp.]
MRKEALRRAFPLKGGAKNASVPEPLSPSISIPLAFRFMLLLAFAMLSLALIFVQLLRLSVTHKQDSDLEKGISLVAQTLRGGGADELAFLELPYYITYTVYESSSKNVLATNDSLLPLLDSERANNYFEKNFYTDSDLNIRFQTKKIDFEGQKLIIECAIDIANDSAAQMLHLLPYLALVALLPVLFISFVLSYLISRQTIASFKKLRSDYDREKEFTSNVSHELKTPISIIYGHANLLKRWGKDDKKQLDESIAAILHETENMNSIVTTLLDMSRIENGKLKVETSRFFVTNFFAKLKEEFKITRPDVAFEIKDEEFLEIETDEQKLHQIFTVVLSNSVKFAGENCRITLEAKIGGNGRIELSSRDNGRGFSENELPHVFERFYKGDSSHDRNVSGSGLGLAIAKVLAKALEAEIFAENAENGGAVIKLVFTDKKNPPRNEDGFPAGSE